MRRNRMGVTGTGAHVLNRDSVAMNPAATEHERDQHTASWLAVVRGAAYLSAGTLVATTVLYLLDATNVLDTAPTFRRSGRGPLVDEATFFAAFFNHQHALWWDIALRDVLGPVAFLSLACLGLGLANLWGSRRPSMQLTVALLSFGAVFSAINSLLYLGELNYWRYGGWTATPAEGMQAIGRSAESIDHLTQYPEAFGFTLVAIALIVLTRAGRAHLNLATAALGYAAGACLLGLVACAVGNLDTGYDLFAFAAGIVVGPAFLIVLAGTMRPRSG
jgi:hypothetical protein